MAKKDKKTEAPGVQRDDALFETLGKNKKRKRRRIIITVVSIVLVLAVVAVVGVSFLQRRVREQFATSQGEVLSYEVTTGSISTVVSGSGSLAVYLPYTSLLRLSDSLTGEVTSFYVSAPETGTMETVEAAMTGLLMERFEDDDEAFSVSSQSVLEDTMSSITSILTILLGGIAAISLVVGGIGIMNIMLVTVTERTREIGIRKAIGASRGTILSQFLMEAVVLCMLGCALGIFLSWAILQTVSTVVSSLDMTFSLDGGVVLIAVAFCFVIGVVFGLYPANKAAKMKPIDALHYGG